MCEERTDAARYRSSLRYGTIRGDGSIQTINPSGRLDPRGGSDATMTPESDRPGSFRLIMGYPGEIVSTPTRARLLAELEDAHSAYVANQLAIKHAEGRRIRAAWSLFEDGMKPKEVADNTELPIATVYRYYHAYCDELQR